MLTKYLGIALLSMVCGFSGSMLYQKIQKPKLLRLDLNTLTKEFMTENSQAKVTSAQLTSNTQKFSETIEKKLKSLSSSGYMIFINEAVVGGVQDITPEFRRDLGIYHVAK
ncbi:MAG: TrbI F-type domain-containing protein [Gammaproteobacteria bacterium]